MGFVRTFDHPTPARPAHFRRGMIPLWMAVVLGFCLLIVLVCWTRLSMSTDTKDGRETIVFWGSGSFGEDIYAVVHQFEQQNLKSDGTPQYKVIMGTAVAKNLTGDAQRLLCAVAGGVPPDVVFFDRFAIGEWAGRDALEDLTPYIQRQRPGDPYTIDLSEYYPWTIDEASYSPPGSTEPRRVYGIPTGVDIRVLYSNANLLRQEGLVDKAGEPRPPADWDELRDYAKRLTRYTQPNNPASGITRLGFGPNYGNSWLYIYAWQAGGEFMNPARTLVTMESPPVVRALHFMTDIYDDAGGVSQVDAFQQSFQSGELDPFIRGQVAMKIDGEWVLNIIGDWKRDMDFIVTPAPMPKDQLALGRQPITWAGGWSLVVPKTAHNKEGAWKLIQFLRSRQTVFLLEQGSRERKESEGKLYLPRGMANRVFYEELIQQHVDSNPRMPRRYKEAYAVLKDLMPRTLIRPVTPVGQLMWEKHRSAYEDAVNHVYADQAKRTGQDEVKMALTGAQVEVQRMLDEVLRPLPKETLVNWRPYFWAYAVLVAMPFVLMYIVYHRRKREYCYKAREVGAALLFASPWMIGFIIFVGGPLLFSILFSFMRYNVLSPAHYVGTENYRQILSDPLFLKSLRNTAFMVLRIPLGMAASLAIALLLNRAIRGIGFYRTAFYMPAIVPLVASSLLWVWLFNPSYGALNQGLAWVFDTLPFRWMHLVPPKWLQDPDWSKPALIVMSLWTAGGGMIIWLAGLQAIPPQLYEAASIDGAGAWKRFRHITIPMLSPYILFNCIIGLIGTMQIFGEAFIMTDGGPVNSTLFYAYHLFREAFQFFRMGYASALAWILFLIVLVLTLVQLWLSKRWVHYDQS